MKTIETLVGMPVVGMGEGQRLGTIEGVEVDPTRSRIAYLRVHGDGHDGVVPWSAIRSVGHDAVMIPSESTIARQVPEGERYQLTPFVGDRPVVTESGRRLGTISSYALDPQTGVIDRFWISGEGVLGRFFGRRIEFTPDDIRTFGRDAIIVSDLVGPDAPHGHAAESAAREKAVH